MSKSNNTILLMCSEYINLSVKHGFRTELPKQHPNIRRLAWKECSEWKEYIDFFYLGAMKFEERNRNKNGRPWISSAFHRIYSFYQDNTELKVQADVLRALSLCISG